MHQRNLPQRPWADIHYTIVGHTVPAYGRGARLNLSCVPPGPGPYQRIHDVCGVFPHMERYHERRPRVLDRRAVGFQDIGLPGLPHCFGEIEDDIRRGHPRCRKVLEYSLRPQHRKQTIGGGQVVNYQRPVYRENTFQNRLHKRIEVAEALGIGCPADSRRQLDRAYYCFKASDVDGRCVNASLQETVRELPSLSQKGSGTRHLFAAPNTKFIHDSVLSEALVRVSGKQFRRDACLVLQCRSQQYRVAAKASRAY